MPKVQHPLFEKPKNDTTAVGIKTDTSSPRSVPLGLAANHWPHALQIIASQRGRIEVTKF